jgi:transcriptional regulator with XRE-family HTH domain
MSAATIRSLIDGVETPRDELARQVGVTPRTIARYANGSSFPVLPVHVVRLAHALGVSIEDIMDTTEAKRRCEAALRRSRARRIEAAR